MRPRLSTLVRPALAALAFAGLGAVFALSVSPTPSFAGAPSAWPSGASSSAAPYAYCGQIVGPASSSYAHQPPVTQYRGRVTGVTAGSYGANVTMALDNGGNMTIFAQAAQLPVVLDAYQRKLTIDFGTRSASTCGVAMVDWIKI